MFSVRFFLLAWIWRARARCWQCVRNFIVYPGVRVQGSGCRAQGPVRE